MILNLFYSTKTKDVYAAMCYDYHCQAFIWNRPDTELDIENETPVFIRYFNEELDKSFQSRRSTKISFLELPDMEYQVIENQPKFRKKCEKALLYYLANENENTPGFKAYAVFVDEFSFDPSLRLKSLEGSTI